MNSTRSPNYVFSSKPAATPTSSTPTSSFASRYASTPSLDVSNAQSVRSASSPGLGSRLWSNVRDATSNLGTTMPILIFLALLVITGIIIYLVYVVKRFSLKTVDLMRSPVITANPLAGEHHTYLGGRLPDLNNGGEFSYSIWVYVENITITAQHKIIMYQGNASAYTNGSSYIYMDAVTNRLYITVRTNSNPETPDSNGQVTLQQINSNTNLMQAQIDYVPLQRWVNVIVAVRDAIMYVYFDGELYSVNSVYDLPTRSDGSRPMILKPIGDVFMGGKADREGVNGYLARGQFMNFGVTLKQAKDIYNGGPYQRSFLSYLGIDNVAVRSPFYWTDPDVDATNKCDNNKTL